LTPNPVPDLVNFDPPALRIANELSRDAIKQTRLDEVLTSIDPSDLMNPKPAQQGYKSHRVGAMNPHMNARIALPPDPTHCLTTMPKNLTYLVAHLGTIWLDYGERFSRFDCPNDGKRTDLMKGAVVLIEEGHCSRPPGFFAARPSGT